MAQEGALRSRARAASRRGSRPRRDGSHPGQPYEGWYIGNRRAVILLHRHVRALVTSPAFPLRPRLYFGQHRPSWEEIGGADVEPEAPVLHIGSVGGQHQEGGWTGRGKGNAVSSQNTQREV